jgi:hypothetical protein
MTRPTVLANGPTIPMRRTAGTDPAPLGDLKVREIMKYITILIIWLCRHRRHRERSDDEDLSDDELRFRRDLKKPELDLDDPMTSFAHTVTTKQSYKQESDFVRKQWLEMRGFSDNGKFDEKKYPLTGDWPRMCKATRLIKRFASPSFAKLTMEEALPLPAPSTPAGKSEKDLVLLQKHFGAVAHLNLAAQEAFNTAYKNLMKFVMDNSDISDPDKAGPYLIPILYKYYRKLSRIFSAVA